MNLKYFSKQGLFLAVCALAMIATGCIREDLEACKNNHRLTLKVVNAAGDEITESGAVLHTTLYVFDKNLNYLQSLKMDAAAIKGRQEIVLDYAKSDQMTLVAWGNMSEKSHAVTEAQRVDQLKMILKSTEGLAVEADSLYFGRATVTTTDGLLPSDQQIVIAPQTGSVKISTIGMRYVLDRFGLNAETNTSCLYTLDSTLDQYTHTGELDGDSVYYNPQAQWVGTEWNTDKYNTYLGDNLTISLDVEGQNIVSNVDKDDDGKPLSVEKGQTKYILLRFGKDGALISVRTAVRPWGYVGQDIDF